MTPCIARLPLRRWLAVVVPAPVAAVLVALGVRAELDTRFVEPGTADLVAALVGVLLLGVAALMVRSWVVRAEVDDQELRIVRPLRPTLHFGLADHRFEMTFRHDDDENDISSSDLHVVGLDGSRQEFMLHFGKSTDGDFFTELVARKRAVDLATSPLV
ncbi:hypothetical protein ACPCG0_11340 [Propionibacteriaceae bacterium Y1923]|uniref:hypothetical protein n=1 Tax=Aestuariimicrobium sp. Y1814 TaxID=3418742 RepID=UPI003C1EC869